MMTFHLKRHFILFGALLLLVAHFAVAEEATTPANSEEEDDSSSEETVEDSNESRRKRSLEALDAPEGGGKSSGGGGGGRSTGDGASPRLSIPGLPDPATILKIAQILQAVGEQVIPILVEGNPTQGLVADRIGRDFQFLRNFKREIDLFAQELKMK